MATQIGRIAIPKLNGASVDHAVEAVGSYAKRVLASAQEGAKSVGNSVKTSVKTGSVLRGVIFATAALLGVGTWLFRMMRRKASAKPTAQVAAETQRTTGEHHQAPSKARSKSQAHPAPTAAKPAGHGKTSNARARRAAK